ncbi:uncharacterized protein DEA37_0001960 [Paragonimus westermani]|uniref:Bicarbonate transporter-like transmembrane domain-containing protein n=1 Tax=Paragonimus westermani TaxID=34504 RepID=A0A5J4NXY3_9TREM|nr:uncharacterized protein DEA37_0001960 [Paragonimus westermani]
MTSNALTQGVVNGTVKRCSTSRLRTRLLQLILIVRVRETRLTTIFSHLLIGLSLLMIPTPLRFIPPAVLNGLFVYMAITAVYDNQLFERILLFITEQKRQGRRPVWVQAKFNCLLFVSWLTDAVVVGLSAIPLYSTSTTEKDTPIYFDSTHSADSPMFSGICTQRIRGIGVPVCTCSADCHQNSDVFRWYSIAKTLRYGPNIFLLHLAHCSSGCSK